MTKIKQQLWLCRNELCFSIEGETKKETRPDLIVKPLEEVPVNVKVSFRKASIQVVRLGVKTQSDQKWRVIVYTTNDNLIIEFDEKNQAMGVFNKIHDWLYPSNIFSQLWKHFYCPTESII